MAEAKPEGQEGGQLVAIGIDEPTETVLREMVRIGIWGETIDEVLQYLIIRGIDDLLRSSGLGPVLREALEQDRRNRPPIGA